MYVASYMSTSGLPAMYVRIYVCASKAQGPQAILFWMYVYQETTHPHDTI